MFYYLYAVKGWPLIAWSRRDRARFRSEDYVGSFDAANILPTLDQLLTEARYRLSQ